MRQFIIAVCLINITLLILAGVYGITTPIENIQTFAQGVLFGLAMVFIPEWLNKYIRIW